MENLKITNHQIFALTASFTCGTAIIIISAGVTTLAKQDAWISVLLTFLFAMPEIWIICFFWSRYPGMTYVDILQKIFGKWIGWIVSASFVIFCLNTVPLISWYIGNFITIYAMPQMPKYIVTFIFIGTISIGLLYGLEAILRSYEIFIYFLSGLFILAMALVSPKSNIENIMPVFENGVIPILKGSFLLSSILIFPMIIFLMIYPVNANNSLQAKKAFLRGFLWGGFLLFLSVIMSILVLGPTITSTAQYPVYLLAKEINLGTVFTRLEFMIAIVWILTLLSRGILWFYTGIIGMSQLFGFKEHKMFVLPLTLIMIVMSQVGYENVYYESVWDNLVWPPFGATFGLIIPILLILVLMFKKIIYRS